MSNENSAAEAIKVESAEKSAPAGHIGPWVLLTLLSLAFLLNYTDRQLVFAIFPVLRREMGFSNLQLGLAGSLFTWTYSLCMPLSGRLADMVPRHRLVILALFLWSFTTLASGASRTIGEFLACRVLMGISESLYVPAAIALISTAHSSGTRSRALSIHGLAQFTGITLGGWYGGWAADHIGWRRGFAAPAAVGVLYSSFLAWRFQDLKNGKDTKCDGIARAPGELFHSLCYLALCAAFLTFCAMLWMLYSWLPTHVYEKFHLSLAKSGLTATLYLQVSSAAGALLGGAVGDLASRRYRDGRLRVVVAGLLVCAPFAWAVYRAASLPGMELFACGFGIFAGFFMANVFASAHDMVSPRNFGSATGILNMVGGLGGGSAIFLTGLLKQSWGAPRLMLAAMISTMLMAVVLMVTIGLTADRARNAPIPVLPSNASR